MHQKKENLKELLENITYFQDKIKVDKPKKADLIRYHLSNWKYYKAKSENSLVQKSKLEYQEKANKAFELYSSFFVKNYNPFNPNA
ncbi:MAG: hypothetical protein ACP5OG_00705 [Candidatus Nanoarchaeia archaeon]